MKSHPRRFALAVLAIGITGSCFAYIADGLGWMPVDPGADYVPNPTFKLNLAGIRKGQQFPDVPIHDEHGEGFKINGRNKYAVVVFGCLT